MYTISIAGNLRKGIKELRKVFNDDTCKKPKMKLFETTKQEQTTKAFINTTAKH